MAWLHFRKHAWKQANTGMSRTLARGHQLGLMGAASFLPAHPSLGGLFLLSSKNRPDPQASTTEPQPSQQDEVSTKEVVATKSHQEPLTTRHQGSRLWPQAVVAAVTSLEEGVTWEGPLTFLLLALLPRLSHPLRRDAYLGPGHPNLKHQPGSQARWVRIQAGAQQGRWLCFPGSAPRAGVTQTAGGWSPLRLEPGVR